MKKLLSTLAALILAAGFVFAQGIASAEKPYDDETFEAEKTKTEIIIPKDQHVSDSFGSVKIEYQPIFDQVRIYYETNYVTYDKGEAMDIVMQCLNDFRIEHHYSNYRYLKDDKERYFKDDRGFRRAQYISTVQFNR